MPISVTDYIIVLSNRDRIRVFRQSPSPTPPASIRLM
jgi:hypothetical protein